MKTLSGWSRVWFRLPLVAVVCAGVARAGVVVDVEAFGESMGGWKARGGKAVEYKISDSGYRTWKPEISPTPDGGVFVSVRIDHRRGMLASDDYASLELSFGPDGTLQTAQSALALQGRRISSDLIRGGAQVTGKAAGGVLPGADRAVQMGGDLVADLSEKLLREKIVEPGRVTFPAAIRHNFNHLYKVVRFEPEKPVQLPGDRKVPDEIKDEDEEAGTAGQGSTSKPEPDKPKEPDSDKPKPPVAPEIRPYGAGPEVKPLPGPAPKPEPAAQPGKP